MFKNLFQFKIIWMHKKQHDTGPSIMYRLYIRAFSNTDVINRKRKVTYSAL